MGIYNYGGEDLESCTAKEKVSILKNLFDIGVTVHHIYQVGTSLLT